MKRFFPFVFFVLAIVSCKDDEKTLSVEGTWLPVKAVVSGCNDSGDNGTTHYDANGCAGDVCRELIFFEDTFTDRVTENGNAIDDSHVYEVMGKKLILYYSNDVVVEVPIEGDNLTIPTSDEFTHCNAVTTFTRKK